MEFGFRFSSESPSAAIPPTRLRDECNRAKVATILFFKYLPFLEGCVSYTSPWELGFMDQIYLRPKADN